MVRTHLPEAPRLSPAFDDFSRKALNTLTSVPTIPYHPIYFAEITSVSNNYARVSTADQNPDHQIDALLRTGVERDNVYLDRASGAKASRPQFDIVLRMLRVGDTLKVTRLGRLSHSMLHLVAFGAELREHRVGLHVIEQGIDTDTMERRAMFGMLSVLAELQRELIVANTKDGLAAPRGLWSCRWAPPSAHLRAGGARPAVV
ncbi:resolvase-like protein [Nonomuraea fuscirosea]|uniref:Resolvase-like protein n=1 Tax=Nonomuraea fuscirosea TaxID=1291556 RepID=A0A2T0LMR3_9ACTN|nr:resolvase-like protein [Nonomuraea fuscirosea]